LMGIKLSKASRVRVDQAVLVAAQRLYDDRFKLNTLYWDRAGKFAQILSTTMLVDQAVARVLEPEDMNIYDEDERTSIVAASIRRLRRKKRLHLEYIVVPVMLEPPKLVKRKMACYWPSTVLDTLARLD
jgi:hypothetical protein